MRRVYSMLLLFSLAAIAAAAVEVYQVERIEDNGLSCPKLVYEIGRVEGEINEATVAKDQAKRAMRAERGRRYGRKRNALSDILDSTSEVIESVKNIAGDHGATTLERYQAAQERRRDASARRRHLMRLHRSNRC